MIEETLSYTDDFDAIASAAGEPVEGIERLIEAPTALIEYRHDLANWGSMDLATRVDIVEECREDGATNEQIAAAAGATPEVIKGNTWDLLGA